MSMEDCLWAVGHEHQQRQKRDLSVYYKDLLAFFWLASFSQKTKKEVEPILEGFHTVDRIVSEQDPIHPRINEQVAYAGLELESIACVQRHPWLKIYHGLQGYPMNAIDGSMRYGLQGYYDLWIQKRNEKYRR